MKRVWIADLLLAIVLPLIAAPMMGVIASWLSSSDPNQADQYSVIVGPQAWIPLSVTFLLAAAWSWMRPQHALRAQLLPACLLLIPVAIVASVYFGFVKH